MMPLRCGVEAAFLWVKPCYRRAGSGYFDHIHDTAVCLSKASRKYKTGQEKAEVKVGGLLLSCPHANQAI